jgi:hypothetical protein
VLANRAEVMSACGQAVPLISSVRQGDRIRLYPVTSFCALRTYNAFFFLAAHAHRIAVAERQMLSNGDPVRPT